MRLRFRNRLTVALGSVLGVSVGLMCGAALLVRSHDGETQGLLLLAGLALIGAGIGTTWFVTRGLTRPIDTLIRAVAEYARGNLNHRVSLERRDEFHRLAEAFNSMAMALQEYMYELKRETADRERLEGELQAAGEVQKALLPESPPELEGYTLVGYTRPARRVGGDFYDFIPLADGRVIVALGDATGKGMPAALLCTQCMSILKTLSNRTTDPAELLTRTSRELHRRIGKSHTFVTLFLFILEPASGRIRYCCAGHPPPFILQPPCDGPKLIEDARGFPLGLFPESGYTEGELLLESGQSLVVYSDGLTEALSRDGEAYGMDQVYLMLCQNMGAPVETMLKRLRRDLRRHIGGTEAFDDVTLVGIHRHVERA